MAITPTQIRWVDPYEKIMSTNAINNQFSTFMRSNKGIIEGFSLSLLTSNSFRLQDGIGVIDKTALKIDQTDINLSNTNFTAGTTNTVYIHFEYHLQTPLYQAYIEVEDSSSVNHNSDQNLIIGFMVIDGAGNISSITYTSGSNSRDINPIKDRMFLYGMFDSEWPPKMYQDGQLKNLKITNVGSDATSITDNLDLVNKVYVDSLISGTSTDEVVKSDSSDADSSYFGGVNKGGYL